MKKYILILLTIVIFNSCKAQENGIIQKIDLVQLKTNVLNKDVQFIDVRTHEEYNRGHIDDAVNFDIKDVNQFKKNVNKLDKEKPIFLYCHSGGRSNKASKLLKEMGFTQIFDYAGGWNEWSSQIKK